MKELEESKVSAHTLYHFGIVLFCLVITICSLDIPFFWDNVYLVSKMAHYYYENSFPSVVLPLELDSGHPPFYAMYVAAMWSALGKTLAVSHWTVFPFLVVLGIAYYHLARFFLPSKAVPFAMLLLLIEPTLLAQSHLGGVDIALLALYLVALNGIFYRKSGMLAISLCLMSAFSLRGIIAVGLIGLTNFFTIRTEIVEEKEIKLQKSNFKNSISTFIYELFIRIKKLAPAYFPSILFVVVWLCYHYQVNGFLASNPDSPWAADYGYVDFKRWVKNLVIIDWRMLDYGRITLWATTIFLLLQWWRTTDDRQPTAEKRPQTTDNTKTSSHSKSNFKTFLLQMRHQKSSIPNQKLLLSYILLPLLFYLPFITLRHAPILHRYFLPTFLLVSILFITLWWTIKNEKVKKIILGVVVISLLSGHFWVYPDHIAKGWDASLAYLPYLELNEEMTDYIKTQNIPFEKVGSEFPAVNPRKFTHLTNELQHFIDKDAYKMSDFPYILQSNVMNDFSEVDLAELQQTDGKWRLEKELKKGQVYLRLYVRK